MTLDVRRSLAFSEVPVIDISSAVAGDTDPTIIESMRDACIDVGFFYVSNHGVPPDVVEQLHSEAARYFARP
ncbi:MAG: 2-oxoglutarate and iron-dependent oxygenase domain-containing protein, partial [Acidimicrobiaceae bacterium]|nr:2-oxoglutarate and iron-dependent oxygenase domain-containing protein [Acidimicrobiaceae bacterium]